MVAALAVPRAILVRSQVAQAAVRESQECLSEVLGVTRSVGYLEGVVPEAGRRAQALAVVPPVPLQVAAEEPCAADHPLLAVVERPSGAVLALTAAPRRDETRWGGPVLEVQAPGTTVASLTAAGATGWPAGARAAGWPTPALDHWPTRRDLARRPRLLDHQASRALAAAERSARATAEARSRRQQHRQPRPGRPLQAPTSPRHVQVTAVAAEEAVPRADAAAVVRAAVREVRCPLDALTGRVRAPDTVRADLTAAAALLREVGGRAVAAADRLDQRQEGLLA